MNKFLIVIATVATLSFGSIGLTFAAEDLTCGGVPQNYATDEKVMADAIKAFPNDNIYVFIGEDFNKLAQVLIANGHAIADGANELWMAEGPGGLGGAGGLLFKDDCFAGPSPKMSSEDWNAILVEAFGENGYPPIVRGNEPTEHELKFGI